MFELGKVFFLTEEQIKEEKQFATALKISVSTKSVSGTLANS